MDEREFGDLQPLQPVEPSTVWKNGRDDFMPWLTQPENLRRLGDALRLRLRPLARDKPVGRFRAGLLCRDAATGSRLVIEAEAAVWLATRLRGPHREALDWLNACVAARFFGVELGLWRIGESRAAAQFRLVAGRPGRPARTDSRRPARPRPTRRAVRWPGPGRRIAVRG